MTAQRRPGGIGLPGEVDSLVAQIRTGGGTAALCDLCLTRVASVSGVGLTFFATPARRFVLGTSGQLIDQVEDLQIRLNEGPCVEAFTSREPVLVGDLADAAAQGRWPRFAAEAVRVGVAAVFTFPVLADTRPIAVLDLSRGSAGPLPDDAVDQAMLFAAAASALLIDDLRGGGSAGAAVSLPAARTQQATGMVMGQATVGAPDALHRLRQHAFSHGLPLAAVVDEVLNGTLRFNPRKAHD